MLFISLYIRYECCLWSLTTWCFMVKMQTHTHNKVAKNWKWIKMFHLVLRSIFLYRFYIVTVVIVVVTYKLLLLLLLIYWKKKKNEVVLELLWNYLLLVYILHNTHICMIHHKNSVSIYVQIVVNRCITYSIFYLMFTH